MIVLYFAHKHNAYKWANVFITCQTCNGTGSTRGHLSIHPGGESQLALTDA